MVEGSAELASPCQQYSFSFWASQKDWTYPSSGSHSFSGTFSSPSKSLHISYSIGTVTVYLFFCIWAICKTKEVPAQYWVCHQLSLLWWQSVWVDFSTCFKPCMMLKLLGKSWLSKKQCTFPACHEALINLTLKMLGCLSMTLKSRSQSISVKFCQWGEVVTTFTDVLRVCFLGAEGFYLQL